MLGSLWFTLLHRGQLFFILQKRLVRGYRTAVPPLKRFDSYVSLRGARSRSYMIAINLVRTTFHQNTMWVAQSILPGTLLSDEASPVELSKDYDTHHVPQPRELEMMFIPF